MLEQIINKRKTLGLTQTEVSQKLGVSIRTYQRFEAGETELKASQFIQLMRILSFNAKERIEYLLEYANKFMED